MSKSSLPGLVERLRCNREDNGNGNDNGTPESCQVGPAVDPASVFCAGGRKQFCQLDTGVCNNKSGIHTGTCKEIPDLCTEDYKPVCGCNEKTYSNEVRNNVGNTMLSAEESPDYLATSCFFSARLMVMVLACLEGVFVPSLPLPPMQLA